MGPGNIILLNGTTSAGKTTIAQALQEVMEVPNLHTGIDQFLIERLPRRVVVYSDEPAAAAAENWLVVLQDGAASRVQIGPQGYRWIRGMYRAVAALCEDGLNVIVDDVIYDPEVLRAAVELLPADQVFFVGVRCPLEVAEERERERGGRLKGGAAIFHPLVHAHGIYDLEVDTAACSPTECALQIKRGLAAKPVPSAFRQLRAREPDGAGAW